VNIYEARRAAAQKLDENMAQIKRDVPTDHDDENVLMWLDYRKLRGLPCLAKGVSGHPTDSFVPGSDEHLEEMTA
jgi:hypothetical protein